MRHERFGQASQRFERFGPCEPHQSGRSETCELVSFSDDPGEAAANYFILNLMGYPDVKVMITRPPSLNAAARAHAFRLVPLEDRAVRFLILCPKPRPTTREIEYEKHTRAAEQHDVQQSHANSLLTSCARKTVASRPGAK